MKLSKRFVWTAGGVMVTFECRVAETIWNLSAAKQIGAEWTWNGDLVKPTIHPSVLSRIEFPRDPVRDTQICHSFIRDGQIQFLDDCTLAFRPDCCARGSKVKTIILHGSPAKKNLASHSGLRSTARLRHFGCSKRTFRAILQRDQRSMVSCSPR